MFFIIQKESMGTDIIQNAIFQDVIRHYKYDHSYEFMSMMDFYKEEDENELFSFTQTIKTPDDFEERYKDAIPVGTVRFIEKYLQIFKGIERDNAIEVPPVLRTDEFLKRKYSIVTRDEIPREGYFFIKDATQQKVFSHKGDLEYFLYDEMFQEKTNEYDGSIRLDPTHF